ncbi:MAG: TonB-dependent receptor [Bacteroidia bacterium]|nr:TonB-dependent receptor [Bacteroidia bacterium]
MMNTMKIKSLNLPVQFIPHVITMLLFLLVGGQQLMAQRTLTGLVLEEDEKGKISPLTGAGVWWQDTQIGTTTDEYGVFHLPDHRHHHPLVISYIGYVADTLNIRDHDSVTVILRQRRTLKSAEIFGKQASTYVSALEPIKTEVITKAELYKAACCNLSESFETNATVDVASTDAVSGAKQIRMLGLSGIYAQMSIENLPGIRGLSIPFGLTQLPGSWIESIQINKGVGSVANGFESISGQINTELKKPFGTERFFLNAYLNQMGRSELNLNKSWNAGPHWGSTILAHGNYMKFNSDRNNDGFMDIPDGWQWNVANRWHYRSGENISGQIGLRLMQDKRMGGTIEGRPDSLRFKFEQQTERADVWVKAGYIFPEKRYKSIGFLANMTYYDQQNHAGKRSYLANQLSAHASLIMQGIIGHTGHKYRTGANFLYDKVAESPDSMQFNRSESVSGAFFEYTREAGRFSMVAGLRADYNQLFGAFVTPRLHLKYNLKEEFTLRLAAGRGQRTPNVFAENTAWLVSQRKVVLPGNTGKIYGDIRPEIGWNAGGGLHANYKKWGREGSISADVYYTWFERQMLADLDVSPAEIWFYNKQGGDAWSAQLDWSQELSRRFDLKASYRLNYSQATYQNARMLMPYMPPHRAMLNLSWHARKDRFLADITANYSGYKRLPGTRSNPAAFQMENHSPGYVLLNAQVTYNVKKWAFYIGCENLGDFYQPNQVLAASNPQSPYFDASYIWGPTYGRMFYAGLRFLVGSAE